MVEFDLDGVDVLIGLIVVVGVLVVRVGFVEIYLEVVVFKVIDD